MPIPREFRLPNSSERRNAGGWHQLLTSVDVHAPRGLQFRGQVLSPGAPFDPADLPRPAVVVENGGSVRTGKVLNSRYSYSNLWVLWTFDFEKEEWREVLRAIDNTSGWTLSFAPAAKRLMQPGASEETIELDARPIAEQLAAAITTRLQIVPREVRCYVLAGLAEHVSREIVKVTDSLSIMKVGYGAEATYPVLGESTPIRASKARFRPRASVA
ncbi:MAG: hypothetical protein JWN34_1095 [Bryobacterales bacterium]|nr:hypothetical protein [Bryobacterales bacterium]